MLISVLCATAVLVPAPRSFVGTSGEFVTAKAVQIREVRDAAVPAEGYRLVVAKDGVTVASSDDAGAFYARQTLRQLGRADGINTVYPCATVEDAPAYRWRGVHFDDVRHFFGKETLKATLELMAQHKMNVLHWHLTDDQGWRLDIPGRPELVKYGAVRPSSPLHRAKHWRDEKKQDTVYETDGQTYGPFFYTEADVKEILAYAAERHITIVPEIELPGHVFAALAAYPELACRPENLAARHPRCWWGIEKDVLCLGNDRSIKLMEDVLDYVCRLFPSPFVHIGGDECPSGRWKDCPKCQARVKAEGLKDEKDLQPWMTRHFVKFLEARGKRAVGWDEYLNGDVPLSSVGMYWRARKTSGAGHARISGAEAVEKGHDMVMCPSSETYFYFGQGLKDDPFEYGGKAQLPLAKVYAFNPSNGVSEKARKHVLGGQCCTWSEFTWSRADFEWKLWPRGCAMAETLWLGDAKPGFDDFMRRMKIHRERLLKQGVMVAPLSSEAESNAVAGVSQKVVDVSRTDPHYFETADGRTFVPIGLNLVSVGASEEALRRYEGWLDKFARNGGNWIRIWLSTAGVEVMPEKAGVYEAAADARLKRIIARCEKLGLKVKLTLEHFRSTCAENARAPQPWCNRRLYAPYSKSMHDFFTSVECRRIYMDRVRHLQALGLGDSPAVACWEPWNEISAAGYVDDYAPWSDGVLAELAKMFPKQMVTQNLGSFSDSFVYRQYEQMASVDLNAFMQVHRYLDPGAAIDVCRGPLDVLAAESVRTMREMRPDRPAVLAETGAVQRNHAGPSILYSGDRQGVMMHDLLFAPFFAGGAGCGQLWHWDVYIDRHDLWWQYARFAKAIEGLDPVAERFVPFRTETRRLRVWGLRGKTTTVLWCRDKASDWAAELLKGDLAQPIAGERLPYTNGRFTCYLPWEDKTVTSAAPILPTFTRSIVVRFPTGPGFARIIEKH